MTTRKQRSLPEWYLYHPIHHITAVTDDLERGRTYITNATYPNGNPVKFYLYSEQADRIAVWDRGEIAVNLGSETYGQDWGHYDNAQIEHWRALNFINKTAFGEGPACAMSILAGGSNEDMALAKIISATRNFIAAEVKGR